jgi:voltage-gated potassium channel
MPNSVRDTLARVPLFSGFDAKHLDRLAKDFSERRFDAGSVVVRQGDDRSMGFFVIAEGEAVVSIDGTDVTTLGPGSEFGAIALISDRVRTATVTAKTALVTYVMTLWDFRSFVQSDSEVSWKLLQQLASMLHTTPAPTH